MILEPVAVALKFGFLAVLYLFLLWVARSAIKDLRSTDGQVAAPVDEVTSMHRAINIDRADDVDPRLRVERAPGLESGLEYELVDTLLLGRGTDVHIQLQDPFSSSHHTQIEHQDNYVVIEDLNSTNGTYLNGERLRGPQPLHAGDVVRIGDSEFRYLE